MLKRCYTVIVFNDTLDKHRKIRISRSFLKYFAVSGSILFIAFISVMVYFTYIFHSAHEESEEVARLRTENKSQKLEIRKFLQQVNEFEKQMVRLENFDKKIRYITALDQSQKASPNKLGIGGSSEIQRNNVNFPFNTNTLQNLSNKIETLKAQASLQEISFVQLDQFFKDRQSFLSSIPSIWPTRGWVTSGFGYRTSPYTGVREMHEGVDVATRMNSDVISPADGIVIRSGRDYSYGVLLEIDHGYGIITRYGHNSKNLVKIGNLVKRGQLIAYTGNTGKSTGPHLHFEVIRNGIPVNPLKYIFE